ncbi:MAG TPA: ImmA/IrrE family metallo-endopeptidase [Methanocorpusculum sp.]|nr:ImmA/IrrE family metallo-endopeptidase [Methanocorpusculum sp.]
MTANSLEISINADVFAWLYRTSGCDSSDVLDTIGISRERFDHYLQSHESVRLPVSDLKKLATLYHRPITAFLIPAPPRNNTTPKDFRREPLAKDYSSDLCQKFIKAQRALRLFAEMRNELGDPSADTQQKYTLKDDPETAAKEERIRLGLDDISLSRDANTAYSMWRDFFADRGIPVFQYNLSTDGVAGFVTEWENARGIVVNSGYQVKGRIFTIFHEYAHILLGVDAGCSDIGYKASDAGINAIEHWCDWFAGAILMPESLICGNAVITKHLKNNEPIEAAKTLARIATVSNQAALIRLRVCNLISPDAGAKELAQWKKDVSSQKMDVGRDEAEGAQKKKGGPDASKVRLSELGDSFVNLAGRSYDAGNITYSTYLETLGISKRSHDRLVMSGDLE